jgi:L-asparaginase II
VAENYQPIFEVTRGGITESVHYGAIAVVSAEGRLIAAWGDPRIVTYTRSSAKPLQALPLIEMGADQAYHLTSKEIATICASHDGTDEHVEVVKGIQAKIGVQESDLLCGTHWPYHVPTAEAMKARGEQPTPNRHNCSCKHTGMLAQARLRGLPISDYVNPTHPVQMTIKASFCEMCAMPQDKVETGIDGCSAPNFALPLFNFALGFARLVDPRNLSTERATACRRITQSMLAHPLMVAGPGRYDTRFMEVGNGRLISKGGAEGYLAMGLLPGVLETGSPGIGIALKVSDGDAGGRVRPAAGLEILRQLGVFGKKELELLADFGPVKPVTNWRKLVVGETRPAFTLDRQE